jgi:hypothetical protein
MSNNFYHLFNIASDCQINRGINWYNEAREFCQSIAVKYNKPYMQVCAVLAALSPRNKWERNKIDCEELVKGNASHKYATFSSNVLKGIKCLMAQTYQEVITILNSNKVTAFFDNIFNMYSQLVTIDTHMYQVIFGRVPQQISDREYNELSQMIIDIANEFKLIPYELQAIVWITKKELTKV